jgi:hypothetical protein
MSPQLVRRTVYRVSYTSYDTRKIVARDFAEAVKLATWYAAQTKGPAGIREIVEVEGEVWTLPPEQDAE